MIGITAIAVSGCTEKKEYASYDDYPVRSDDLREIQYTPEATTFALWAPTAEEVRVRLYNSGHEGDPEATVPLKYDKEGTWKADIKENLEGKFYTFEVKVNNQWLGETPGINARAVGVNGKRGAIVDMPKTNPAGWENDKRPALNTANDMVIYEMHHRDFSIHPSSGINSKGKFVALTQSGSVIPGTNVSTGIDHLVDLGITHVHILPSYDYASVDETALSENKYNWGYDPVNYNVPEGSYSTDPYNPETRIKEFKQMVQSLHKAGIRVVLDVVYNHTYSLENSGFEKTVPGYFYRKNAEGEYADASACGNETASDRAMMRKYMIESVKYWINEYHIDGFRFDLMGIHDIETMNQIREAVSEIDPTICVYGEGWAARPPQYPMDMLAMKANVGKMPGIAVFSDEFRDGMRGPFNNDQQGAFLAGIAGEEESVKFGIVGGIEHPQIDYSVVNYTQEAWAKQPNQFISYVSCHDDMCLVDRLKTTIPGLKTDELIKLDKLAQTAVFTSQGIPFIYAGEEVLRNKKGVHNSFESPDSINAIDWTGKVKHKEVYDYYKNLIRLRKNHPAFRMGDAEMVRKHLEFLPTPANNIIAFVLKDNANGDKWNDIVVVLNSNKTAQKVTVPQGNYTVVCKDGKINEKGMGSIIGKSAIVPAQSALIMYK